MMRRGETQLETEIRHVWPDSTEKWLLLRAQIMEAGPSLRIVGVVVDVTRQKQAEERQQILAHELEHRIKNILTMVSAIVSQTLRGTELHDREAVLLARVRALAEAQSLLTGPGLSEAALADVVRSALRPFDGLPISLSGPHLSIGPKMALSLSLAVNELATNAVKYGALSSDQGRVDMAWSFDERKDSFELQWVESGGPAVQPPQKRGFGSRLIERGLAQDLGGSVRLEFKPEGIVCTIRTPLTEVQAQIERHDDRAEKVEP
jgi:two-component sensor histidine kinase